MLLISLILLPPSDLLTVTVYAQGFGVGHQRSAETKGVWVWDAQPTAQADGTPLTVIYMDTEGFDSTGASDVYDDRIFALAALSAATMIYNLP
jgi:hypothetical protein